MKPKINEKMHLVMPIFDDGDEAQEIAWVHSTPISKEVFDLHFWIMSKTYSAIFTSGLGAAAGPRVAAKLMKKLATESSNEGDLRSYQLLRMELMRLTNVLVGTPSGWEALPIEIALSGEHLSEEDFDQVENALVFFTVVSRMQGKHIAKMMLNGALPLWAAQISSLSLQELQGSLPTLKGTASTGASPKPVSSVVY